MTRSGLDRFERLDNHDASLARLQSGANITNFFMEFDPLTYFQTHIPALPFVGKMPIAVGTQVQSQGLCDPVLQAKVDALTNFISHSEFPEKKDGESYLAWWERFKEWLGELQSYATQNALAMLDHHKMNFVEFGLMVHQLDNPSSPDSRQRTWDIFGGNDPDQ